MSPVQIFVKERNEALFSLNREKIEEFSRKYSGSDDSELSDEDFWAGIFRAILGVKCSPPELVTQAKSWLLEHGYSAA